MDLPAALSNPSTAVSILFIVFLCLFFWKRRSQIEIQSVVWPLLYMILYRTQVGLRWMTSVAKRFPTLLTWIGWLAVVSGFGGMALIFSLLAQSTRDLFLHPSAVAGIMPVLPIPAEGVFFVRFDYWIICIFIILVVHEFSHGLLARRYGVPVKSSGLAALGIIVPLVPGAFVEPDENELGKRKSSQQLAVFAAGPFANIVTAVVVTLLFVGLSSMLSGMIWVEDGVSIVNVTAASPAEFAGFQAGDRITSFDGVDVLSMENFTALLATHKPGDAVAIETNRSVHIVTLGAKNDTTAYLGVMAKGHTELAADYQSTTGRFIAGFVEWLLSLLYHLSMLNVGIGLFNLLPLWVVDGGRMLLTALQSFLPRRSAFLTWHMISLATLVMVLLNVFSGFF